MIRTRTRPFQGVRNVSFLKKFTNVKMNDPLNIFKKLLYPKCLTGSEIHLRLMHWHMHAGRENDIIKNNNRYFHFNILEVQITIAITKWFLNQKLLWAMTFLHHFVNFLFLDGPTPHGDTCSPMFPLIF